MRNLCFLCSAILIALGPIGFLLSDKAPKTAFIPSAIGVLMLIGGLVAIKNTKIGMHIAVLFSLLGFLGPISMIIKNTAKGTLEMGKLSTQSQIITAVVCLFFTIMAVRSFIAARKAK